MKMFSKTFHKKCFLKQGGMLHRLRGGRPWLCGPFLARLVFSNENACLGVSQSVCKTCRNNLKSTSGRPQDP